MAVIKKDRRSGSKDMEKLEPSYIIDENRKKEVILGNHLTVSHKIKHRNYHMAQQFYL